MTEGSASSPVSQQITGGSFRKYPEIVSMPDTSGYCWIGLSGTVASRSRQASLVESRLPSWEMFPSCSGGKRGRCAPAVAFFSSSFSCCPSSSSVPDQAGLMSVFSHLLKRKPPDIPSSLTTHSPCPSCHGVLLTFLISLCPSSRVTMTKSPGRNSISASVASFFVVSSCNESWLDFIMSCPCRAWLEGIPRRPSIRCR